MAAVAGYPLDVVEVDHTPLNWVVICDRTGLPLGIAAAHRDDRRLLGLPAGFYVSFYGAGLSSVSGAVRCALSFKADMVAGLNLEHDWIAEGIPDTVKLDNGLEFHSPVFQRMGWELGSNFTYCRVRTPWLKPRRTLLRVARYVDPDRGLRAQAAGGQHHQHRPKQRDAAIMFTAFVHGLIRYAVDFYPFQINETQSCVPTLRPDAGRAAQRSAGPLSP